MRHRHLLAATTLTATVLAACATSDSAPGAEDLVVTAELQPQVSGTTALLQAVSPVNEQVAWASGHQGTWVRTVDGGVNWTTGRVSGADSLEFRDVHAVSADTAILMSAGPGALSRIYRTTDAGANWELLHTNPDSAGFYDCMDFWDADHGVLFGDSVDGELVVRVTADGGRSWLPPASLPDARPGEGGFAASGRCVATTRAQERDVAWIATGNSDTARVLRSMDGGTSWEAVALPLVAGDGAGATAVTFRDGEVGVVVGGDIGGRDSSGTRVALSTDGGASWRAGGVPAIPGAVYGAAYAPGESSHTLAMVGPGGAAISHDDGATWQPLDEGSYWSVAFASPRVGWMVGPRGRLVMVRLVSSTDAG